MLAENAATPANPIVPPWGSFRPHMNVRYLEVFWAVMRSGNQREAARLLGLSQPAVSKMLRYTETQIGVLLFRRSKGRLQPTPEGEVFFKAVDGIFTRLDAAARLARDLRRLTGQITFAAIPGFSAALIPDALGRFLEQHRMVRVGVKILPPAEVVARVADSQADVGLTFGPVEPGLVDIHVLHEVAMTCAVPRAHPLSARASLGPADLDGERLITATERPLWGKALEAAFAAAGVLPHIAVECTQSDLACAMAEAGAGIAIVPPVPLRPDTAMATSVIPFLPAIRVGVVAVTNRSRPVPSSVASLIAELKISAHGLAWG